ncbi:MAG: tRNA (adenosine(37)-N6)-dimethylallyltransferase MiaA [Rubricoccaceae bacterium]
MLPLIAGPTASGKSALAVALAEIAGGEVVSADSRQVYRELEIGTAKPDAAQRARVPHHFVDERSLAEPFTAGQFAREAEARIAAILSRGAVPVVAGGSTLYLEALVHGLGAMPPAVPALRAHLEDVARTPGGRQALFDELRAADPETAATLDPTKSQRLVRMVEVLRSTGRAPAAFRRQVARPRYRFLVCVLDWPRQTLYARIDARVDAMLAAGLIEENRRLLEAFPELDTPALRTIGYRESRAYLRGECTFEEMVTRLKRNSRRYAKRQLTWFRRHPEYVWIDGRTARAEEIYARWRGATT